MFFNVNLDDNASYIRDKGNVMGSVVAQPAQLRAGWSDAWLVNYPSIYRDAKKIVVAGMGGSALGARIVKSMEREELSVPFEIATEYRLPNYVDQNTLVILSSYSGNTEETLTIAEEVIRRKALVVVLASGGRLLELAKERDWPFVVMDEKLNPSGQPRMALGLNLGCLLGILSKCGFIKLRDKELEKAINDTLESQRGLVREVPTAQNSAKLLATKIKGKQISIVTSRHLMGAAYDFKNQLNENAKSMAFLYEIPEMNHHALEGLEYPKDLRDKMIFVFFDSKYFDPAISKRIMLTEEVLQKQGYQTIKLRSEGGLMWSEVFELIQFGAFVSFYLAILSKIDPSPIPWVDYFKKRLSEM